MAELLHRQTRSVSGLVGQLVAALDEGDLARRVVPGANMIGFTLWHILRVQDWAVHTLVRGEPEVAFGLEWAGPADPAMSQVGYEVGLEVADEISRALTTAGLKDYTEALGASLDAWFGSVDDDLLQSSPDVTGHQPAAPGYQGTAYRELVEGYVDIPAWRFLAGSAYAHGLVHAGDVDLQVDAVLRERSAG